MLKDKFSCYYKYLVILSLVNIVLFSLSLKNVFAEPVPETWQILADEIRYDHNADVYIAEGHVVVTGQDKKVTADYVRYEKKDRKIFAEGNVTLTTAKDRLTGDSVFFDLETETGEVANGMVFIQYSHFYLKSKKIHKTGEQSYYMEDVTITACPPEDPDWKITGKKVKVTLEGYGSVSHAAFWAKKMPMLYTPYFFFPAKKERQTGLLASRFDISERMGFVYEQPFFWAINDSMDATFNSHYLEKRGEKIGAEFRYMLDHRSKGTIMLDYLKDRQTDTGGDETDLWGYEEDFDTENRLIRPHQDRYWFRMKQDHYFSDTFSAKLDLDIVSDQDFLMDFKQGFTGFEETDRYFGETFGRPLDAFEDDRLAGTSELNKTRLNRLNLNKRWQHYLLDGEVRWNDHVINRTLEETDSTEHKLPVINFGSTRQKIGDSRFSFDLASEYVRYYRADARPDKAVDFMKMHRLDAHPRVYLDMGYAPFFYFEPSLGVRETAWYVDEYQEGPQNSTDIDTDDIDRTFNRGMYDVRLDLSTDVERIFSDIHFFGIDRIKHTITPQLVYNYTPDMDQERFPDFAGDTTDRVPAMDRVTFSINNTFTSKEFPIGTPGDDGKLKPVYRELCIFKLTQSYDRNITETDYSGPLLPLISEFDIYPVKYFSLATVSEWNHYNGRFKSHNMKAGISDNRGDWISCERFYSFDPDNTVSDTIDVSLFGVLTRRVSVTTALEYDLKKKKNIETAFGLLYNADCWSLNLNVTDNDYDRTYEFMLKLTGLGGMGSSISTLQ